MKDQEKEKASAVENAPGQAAPEQIESQSTQAHVAPREVLVEPIDQSQNDTISDQEDSWFGSDSGSDDYDNAYYQVP